MLRPLPVTLRKRLPHPQADSGQMPVLAKSGQGVTGVAKLTPSLSPHDESVAKMEHVQSLIGSKIFSKSCTPTAADGLG